MRALWADDPVTFKGEHYSVENAFFAPKPVQQPAPPIWVAGNSKAALRRTARFGDVWHPVRPSFETLERLTAELNGYVEQEGRAPGSVEVAVKCPIVIQSGPPKDDEPPTRGRVSDIVDAIKRYHDLGASQFVLDVVPETLSNALDTMERFAQEIRPQLS